MKPFLVQSWQKDKKLTLNPCIPYKSQNIIPLLQRYTTCWGEGEKNKATGENSGLTGSNKVVTAAGNQPQGIFGNQRRDPKANAWNLWTLAVSGSGGLIVSKAHRGGLLQCKCTETCHELRGAVTWDYEECLLEDNWCLTHILPIFLKLYKLIYCTGLKIKGRESNHSKAQLVFTCGCRRWWCACFITCFESFWKIIFTLSSRAVGLYMNSQDFLYLYFSMCSLIGLKCVGTNCCHASIRFQLLRSKSGVFFLSQI